MKSLALAAGRDLRSVAFPAISTGIFGYPLREAAEIATREVRAFLETASSIDEVLFVLFGVEALEVFRGAIEDGQDK